MNDEKLIPVTQGWVALVVSGVVGAVGALVANHVMKRNSG
jgi:hypothetical protein